MNEAKYLEVIEKYEKLLSIKKVPPGEFPDKGLLPFPSDIIAHCLQMLPKMKVFLKEGRIDKLNRWLGFVQGVLWAHGFKSLYELKNDSRPDS